MECDVGNNDNHGHNKHPCPSISSSPPHSPPTPPPLSAQRSCGNGCFRCGKQGHWARDCPDKTPKKQPSSSSPSNSIKNGSVSPMVRCPCGAGFCLIFTSTTSKNPGRMFYTCPVDKKSGKCGFFKWYDQLSSITGRTPMCPCGAGICSLNKASSTDSNKEKWYFACRIKKNHGACRFEEWVDSGSNIVNNSNERENMGCSSIQARFDDANNDLENTEAPLEHSSEISSDPPVQDDIPNPDVVMQEAAYLDNPLQVFQPESPSFDDSWRRIPVVAGITKTEGIGDPVSVPEDVGISDSEGSFRLEHRASNSETNFLPSGTPRQDAQSPGIVSSEPLESPGIMMEDEKASLKSILKTFGQVLLNQFECMNPLDPEQMLKVAEPIFNTKLSTEYSPFVDGVEKYIHNISLLASIDKSIQESPSSQELTKRHESKELQFDQASRRHSEAEAAYIASKNHLQSLGEEVSRIRGILVELEKQMVDCEAQTEMLKAQVDEISEDIWESKSSMEAAFQDMAKALELEERRESVRGAAKAALEAARVWLDKL